MPEWPDLHVLRDRLAAAVVGRVVSGVRVRDPIVLRTLRPADEVLVGRRFEGVAHRGKFLLFELDRGARLVVNPMLSGLFELRPAGARASADTRLVLALDDGNEVRYRDDTRMGKVYLLEPSAPLTVPGLDELGPDAGALDWHAAEFAARARRRGGEVRRLLMDQRFVSGIGNAYADEILWEAALHPKRRVASLSAEEMERLHRAVGSVLSSGVRAVEAGLPASLGMKVRDHMRVRGRRGEPCPRCGAAIVETRQGEGETYLCPRCQVAPKGQLR